jgi:hypothetical protein
VVVDEDVVHAGADCLDDAGCFVAECDRQGPWAGSVDYGQVGVADAGCLDPDQQLSGLWGIELEFLEAERLGLGVGSRAADRVEDGGECFHSFASIELGVSPR